VQGKSCFDYFHPDEVPFARSVHSRGVLLDKAAVLHYARIRGRDGRWVSCECCFTIVHDVLVACTSIYLRGEKSQRRALEAPQIRRLFSSSPRDPRYHMLEHLSPKFRMPPMEREPRAALILNRFTRNLSIMFATNAVTTILGMRPDEIKEKSFYECIQENCLQDAIRCLESAKANESIAYLRFWFRDPRSEEEREEAEDEEDEDDDMGDTTSDSESGGVQLNVGMDVDGEFPFENHGQGSGSGAHLYQPGTALPPMATAPTRPARHSPGPSRNRRREPESFELEAVVSCTSDGLVVVLRKARPPIPAPHPLLAPALNYENGLFAAPWGQNPIQPQVAPELLYTFRPPLLPQHMPLRENVKAAGGPPLDQLMRSIRDVAVFAWALVGINGNLAVYGRGLPRDRAQPEALPIWDPDAGDTGYQPPENNAAQRWLPQDKGKAPERSESHHTRHAAYQPREPSPLMAPVPQRSTYAPSQPPSSGLEHYTYGGGSSTWSQPAPQYRTGAYEQPSYRLPPDPFSPGPAVLPPIQAQNYDREPQPHRYEYGGHPPQPVHPQPMSQPMSLSSSSQGSSTLMGQPHEPRVSGTTPQPYSGQGLPPPIPTTSASQSESISAFRYLWQ
jgi:hypothetical protein